MSSKPEMDAERWQRIQQLFGAVLEAAPEDRRRILEASCPDDDLVREEVATLLKSVERTSSRMDDAVRDAARGVFEPTAPGVGDRIGQYRLVRIIGSGGMGAVYLGERADGQFERRVAVKIIRPDIADRKELLFRFRREGQILADLDHPNIARMWDAGVTETGYPYLVMEYVDGQPIHEYCSERGLSIQDRLALFRVVCNAVQHAHSHRVVHRDLKPSNIFVTREGAPKLLDFGIASLIEGAPGSPVATITRTAERMMTPAYASPEAIRGEAITEAADVYALGVVLYELVALRHPYLSTGQSPLALAQRIYAGDAEPPDEVAGSLAATLAGASGRQLSAIVLKAIRSDPADRYPSLHDLSEDIQRYLSGLPVSVRPESPRSHVTKFLRRHGRPALMAAAASLRSRPWLAWTAAAVFFVLAAIAVPSAYVHLREKSAPREPVQFQLYPPESTRFTNGAVSPDGRQMAFVGMRTYGSDRLWLRKLDSLESRPLPGTEGVRGVPLWSPDSRFLVFTVPGKLKRMEVSSGSTETVCAARNPIVGGFWADKQLVFGSMGGGLSRVAVTGGECQAVTTLDPSRQESMHSFPVLLPDRKHYLYAIRADTEHTGIYLGSLDHAAPAKGLKTLVTSGTGLQYTPSPDERFGRVVFVRDGTLMTQRFDTRRLELTGEPSVIATRLATALSPVSVSPSGVLCYQVAAGPRQLTWLDRQGNIVATVGKPDLYNRLALSPDGTQVVVQIGNDIPPSDIWVMEFQRGVSKRLTFDPHLNVDPLWLPDGGRIIVASNRSGRFNLFKEPVSGTGNEEPLFQSNENKYPTDVSRDGRWLLYTRTDPATADDLWVAPLDGKAKPFPYVNTEFAERLGQFSPDGRWVAYISDESGRFEVYVRPFPLAPDSGKWVISTAGGVQPRWRRDGKELLFISPDNRLMSVDVSLAPEFRAAAPVPLFKTQIWDAGGVTNGHRWDISRDGQRFLVNASTEPASESFSVVLDWQAKLIN